MQEIYLLMGMWKFCLVRAKNSLIIYQQYTEAYFIEFYVYRIIIEEKVFLVSLACGSVEGENYESFIFFFLQESTTKKLEYYSFIISTMEEEEEYFSIKIN